MCRVSSLFRNRNFVPHEYTVVARLDTPLSISIVEKETSGLIYEWQDHGGGGLGASGDRKQEKRESDEENRPPIAATAAGHGRRSPSRFKVTSSPSRCTRRELEVGYPRITSTRSTAAPHGPPGGMAGDDFSGGRSATREASPR